MPVHGRRETAITNIIAIATLDALAKQVERSLAVAEIKVPHGVLAAIRAAKQTKVSADVPVVRRPADFRRSRRMQQGAR